MRRVLRLLVSLSLLVGVTPDLAAAETGSTTLIRAGQLLDVRSGELLPDQSILIRNQRIVEIGPRSRVAEPEGAEIVDLSDLTVLPGLIDSHTHITFDHRYHGYEGLSLSVPREAILGVMNARKMIDAGFTAGRNVGARSFTDVALRDSINAGEVIGPRLRVSGPSLGMTGGHCDDNLLPFEYHAESEGVANGPWAARAKVREVIKYGADVIKFCATGGVLSKGDEVGASQYTPEEMQALIDEAHRLGRKVAAHAHGTEGIKMAIRAGVDSIEHASLIDDEGISLAREKGTYLVMDIYNDTFILEEGAKVGMLPESLEKERQIGQLQRNNFKKAHEAGIRMAFGTDGAVYPHGDNGKQFAYMVQYGMTPLEAIQAATLNAADLLGWSADIGAIEKGKYGDLIAVAGNPLQDVSLLEDVKVVVKGGTVVKR